MNLHRIRHRIDALDRSILVLLEHRMALALQTRRLKEEIHDTDRERQVLDRIERGESPLLIPAFRHRLYELILDESRRLQARPNFLCGIGGQAGSFITAAAEHLDPAAIPVTGLTAEEISAGVASGFLDWALLPASTGEPAAAGGFGSPATARQQIRVGVPHALLGPPGIALTDIQAIFATEAAYRRCRRFLATMPVPVRICRNEVPLARRLAGQAAGAAGVIASPSCAQRFALTVLQPDVHDSGAEQLTFYRLTRADRPRPDTGTEPGLQGGPSS